MSKGEIVQVDAKQFLEMVGELPFSPKQVNLLLKATPTNFIHERDIPGGGKAKYVSTQYIVNSLNLITGFKWDFEIVDEEEKHGQIIVRGKLSATAKDGSVITKTQYGRSTIKLKKSDSKPMDYGNDKKAAASDALKKCASLLGIAWDIYGQEDMREIQLAEATDKAIVAAEKTAEQNEHPIEEVRAKVIEHLDSLSATDKMRALRTVNASSTKSLTDADWRYLFSQIGKEKK